MPKTVLGHGKWLEFDRILLERILGMRICVGCSKVIPAVRIAVLPHTQTCIGCSMEKPLTEEELNLDGSDPDDLKHMVTQRRDG